MVPELPEVETVRRQLGPRITGRVIVDAGSHWSDKFTPAMEAVGTKVGEVDRRGKYLVVALDDGHELVIHLGMTGRLETTTEPGLDHPHLRAWWQLDDGYTLTFHDIRRFGRIRVVPTGDYSTIPTLAELGPDPFNPDFTGDSLWQAIRSSRRHLKTQLLSQRPVAGIGNIYADEALWLARINPSVRTLSRPRAARLAESIREALASGITHGGTTLRDYVTVDGEQGRNQHHLHCYGRAGEPCERCGTTLRSRSLDARTTTWCPVCQSR
jgi:formamidopyrimidine-DNA glycosylase